MTNPRKKVKKNYTVTRVLLISLIFQAFFYYASPYLYSTIIPFFWGGYEEQLFVSDGAGWSELSLPPGEMTLQLKSSIPAGRSLLVTLGADDSFNFHLVQKEGIEHHVLPEASEDLDGWYYLSPHPRYDLYHCERYPLSGK